MMGQNSGPLLSTVFIDYDNIYQSLKKKSEEAAMRFAKDSSVWLSQIESGQLITSTKKTNPHQERQLILNRCYGNPVPRRNSSDNSTDMSSFPFVRHLFLRAGLEVIDCPPLTSQLKNSAEIRIVMDINDVINHQTRFDEFIILSGDADFTPILYRLRAHARRTIVYVNELTAAPYSAIADGEIREVSLINSLLEVRDNPSDQFETDPLFPEVVELSNDEKLRREIVSSVVNMLQNAGQPIPVDVLADRVSRDFGPERTQGSGWAGMGSFIALLAKELPSSFRISNQSPYYVYDANQAVPTPSTYRTLDETNPKKLGSKESPSPSRQTIHSPTPRVDKGFSSAKENFTPIQKSTTQRVPINSSVTPSAIASSPNAGSQIGFQTTPAKPSASKESSVTTQQSIARIHNACQVPPLSPPEYRALFDAMAQEILTNGLTGAQTLSNIIQRTAELGIKVRREDVRFVLEVVSEADPWFEQGATADIFSSRFRNYVIARCRNQDLQLAAGELDLIDTWFGVSSAAPQLATGAPQKEITSGATFNYPTQPNPASFKSGLSGTFYPNQDQDLPLMIRNRSRS